MGFKQEQYTGDFMSASNFQAVNGDSLLIDNNAIMTDQEDDELESYNNHFGTTDSYPGAQYTTSLSQQQHEQKEEYYDRDADQDADSEMLDGEEDEELLDYDEDSELDEEEVDVDEHDVEEELESFDEEDEEEEEDGGSEGLAGNEKPGATEDDAIELSD
jgi:hypothetical protein